MMVNIDGLDRAAVLAALYNVSRQLGRGFHDERGQQPLTQDEAQEILVNQGDSFDYLYGRVLKVHLPVGADTFDATRYDSRNAPESALVAIMSLRSTGDVNNDMIKYMHEEGTYLAQKLPVEVPRIVEVDGVVTRRSVPPKPFLDEELR